MKSIEYLLLIIILGDSLIYSQEINQKSDFISIHSGIFSSSIDQFTTTYNSQFAYDYGLEFALATSVRIYVFVKATYFSKNGSPVIRVFDNSSIPPIAVTEVKEGFARFTQLLLNEGFMYNFFLGSEWTLGFNGGITFSLVSEEARNARGDGLYSTDASGMLGFFVGAVFEREFNKSHFSIFFESQFNYIKGNVLRINYTSYSYTGNYGGLNLNAGIRFYFSDRKFQ
jgi:hypothetical protein